MALNKLFYYLRNRGLANRGDSILVTDILFPSKYAMWRIAETTSFIRDKSADILVYKQDSYAGLQLEADYEVMMHKQGFEDYNILIFDSRYNHLNRFNRRIDGTRYNGGLNASYLVTRHENFEIYRYALVYHIFLMCYQKFNKSVFFPKWRQAVHLYPGGGLLDRNSVKILSHQTKVISTHPNTTAALSEAGHPAFIEALVGTYLGKFDGPPPQKPLNRGILRVGFASMGHSAEKGAEKYVQLAKLFYGAYPSSQVQFISIGREPLSNDIIHYSPMPMSDLFDFFCSDLDVIVSMDTGIAFNGWPLGCEAALAGAVLATTDPHSVCEHYGLAGGSIFCFDLDNLEELVNFIRYLDKNRMELQERSVNCQSTIWRLLSYENQQDRIFKFLGI